MQQEEKERQQELHAYHHDASSARKLRKVTKCWLNDWFCGPYANEELFANLAFGGVGHNAIFRRDL